ncbi:MAG: selenocysteine-specific translation elongation factor [Armatimonadota bacterium]
MAQTEHIVIGTAGHVDHGKTALIERLTGINPDRLREEQERGLSIDLGFAYFDLPGGGRAGIVDVPGHERFIKNMLAGATGVDLVMLVVAADEGVMPQTREHVDIVTILGVETGLVVITKIDLVEPEWRELVAEEVREELAGSIFGQAPMVFASSVTGEGLDDLRGAIEQVAAAVPSRDTRGPARLNVDRIFTMRGFGTVITGTLVRGTVHTDDTLEMLPVGGTARVRAIELHGERAESAEAAQRVALNLTRLEAERLERGVVLAAPGSMQPTYMLDAELSVLGGPDIALKNRDRVRVHVGTAEIMGRAYILEADSIAPGQSALVQLRLEQPTATSRGERFVVRRYSPMVTIGGGVVLDPNPRRHRRYDEAVLAALRGVQTASPAELVAAAVERAGAAPMSVQELVRSLQLEESVVQGAVEELARAGEAQLLPGGQACIARSHYQALRGNIRECLAQYHRKFPLRGAMPKNQLQSAVGSAEPALLDAALEDLAAAGEIAADRAGVRLADHAVQLSAEQRRALEGLVSRALKAGFAPPTRDELLSTVQAPDAQDLLAAALAQGDLVAVEDRLYHADTIRRAKDMIRDHVGEEGSFTVSEFRDWTGSTRKYVIPLLEHLDRSGFTQRSGDGRRLGPAARDEAS